MKEHTLPDSHVGISSYLAILVSLNALLENTMELPAYEAYQVELPIRSLPD